MFLFAVIALAGSVLGPLVVEPGGYRYALPASLAATLLFVIAAKHPAREFLPLWTPAAVMTLAAVLLLKTLHVDIRAHNGRIDGGVRFRQQLDDIIAQQGVSNPVVLYSFRVPQPSLGLLYAAPLLAEPERVVRRIESRYPHEGYLDLLWSKPARIVLPSPAQRWDFVVAPRGYFQAFEDAYQAAADERLVMIGQVNDYLIVQRQSLE